MTLVERPIGLAAGYYTDPEVFAVEMERVFARSWVMVGHVSQLVDPGTVITATVGDESVLIVNDTGQLRAMYNVCQHRGHQLVSEQEVRVDRLTCRYHAWTYSLDGRLLHARGESVGPLCVPEVRLEFQAGFMFVNLDAEATPLAEAAPGVEEELLALVPGAARRVLSARLTHEIRANWKVVVENYNECYHCPNVHKYFTQGVVAPGSYRIAPQGQVIRHTADPPTSRWARDPTPTPAAGARAEPPVAGGARAEPVGGGARGGPPGGGGEPAVTGYRSFYVWPVSSIQCYFGEVFNTFRWVPLAVDRTLLIREWWLVDAEATEAESKLVSQDWENTAAEDFELVESVQRGISSRGYRPGPLIEHPSGVCDAHTENSVRHLQNLLLTSLDEAA